ncbi:hypothetical protein [Promicromonospora kroppenstedtii]|uniref:hypothetical protein n=1 Tax=Promicromonospora kroppenstedtii TaxID=440482 RepID=UPI00056CCB29|nr:hypothetical protein [Promicromonospora kroppenstedtii]
MVGPEVFEGTGVGVAQVSIAIFVAGDRLDVANCVLTDKGARIFLAEPIRCPRCGPRAAERFDHRHQRKDAFEAALGQGALWDEMG